MAAPVFADTFQWTGGSSNSNWNDAGNWSNTTAGGGTDADGIPDLDDTANFTADAMAAGGSAASVDVALGVTVTVGSGSSSETIVGNTISNAGEIGFISDTFNHTGGPDQRLRIDSAVTLNGGGTVRFSGAQTGISTDGGGALTNVDNTLRGGGTIGNTTADFTLNNQGTIIAENGTLSVRRTTLNNTGGAIEVGANGNLLIETSTVFGGSITGAVGARLRGDTLRDLTIAGSLIIGNGTSSTTTLEGMITNTGEIGFISDTFDHTGGPDQRLRIDSPVTLDGGGTIRFTDGRSGISTDGGGALTNVNHTIRGNGTIGNTTTDFILNNQGTIIAENGTLSVRRTTLNNTGGAIEVGANGFFHSEASTVFGGSITGSAGGRLQGGTLRDLTTAGSLIIGNGTSSTTTLEGMITNTGEIGFISDTFNHTGLPDQRLRIDSAVTLNGGGTIRFADGRSGISTDAAGALTNLDNTIRGNGAIGNTSNDFTLNNQGTIIAENGALTLRRTSLDNTGGTIELASDGLLTGSQLDITGGVIHGALGGRLGGDNIVLRDLTTTGSIAIGNGTSSATLLEGTITNEGNLGFIPDNFNHTGLPDQRLRIDSAVTLDGGGTIRFTHDRSGISTDAVGELTNLNNTIRGNGTIGNTGNDFVLNNQGTIIAENGTLTVRRTTLDNTGGTIELASDGLLTGSQLDITGGIVHGASGGRLGGNDITLRNLKTTGSITLGNGNSSNTLLEGTFTNEGELGFIADNFNHTNGPDQRLRVDSAVTLDGGGTIRFTHNRSGISTDAAGELTNLDNTIRGNGVIGDGGDDFTLNNQGTIIAERGTLSLQRTTLDNTGGTIFALLDGNSPAQSGRIVADTAIDLEGELGLAVGESFTATVGQTFRILTATSLNGSEFDSLNLLATGDYEFGVIYGVDFVDVEILSISTGPVNTDGDYDNDGDVDADDIDFYSGNVNSEIAIDGIEQLNLNRDGVITLADHNIHVQQFVETSNGQIGTFLGDANLDGSVDVLADAAVLILNLNSSGSVGFADGDFNADQRVDVLGDAAILVQNLGLSNNVASTPATAAVPEPSSLLPLLGSLIGFASRRKRKVA